MPLRGKHAGTREKKYIIMYVHRKKERRNSEGRCSVGFKSLYAQFGKLSEAGEAGWKRLLWGCTVDLRPDVARLGGKASAL